MMIEREDYSFLFDPPKDSDVFTRTLYYGYPHSPSSNPEHTTTTQGDVAISTSTTTATSATTATTATSSLGDNRHAATLSKFAAGIFSSNSAAVETVAPFLNNHIPDQVHISDGRQNNEMGPSKVYCYRHQPDLRCQRRTPQEDTMAEIQKVSFRLTHANI